MHAYVEGLLIATKIGAIYVYFACAGVKRVDLVVQWCSARGGCKTQVRGSKPGGAKYFSHPPHRDLARVARPFLCAEICLQIWQGCVRAPNGNRQRRLSSCRPQCPSYPLPGDYCILLVMHMPASCIKFTGRE
jgi:hypothetical protein